MFVSFFSVILQDKLLISGKRGKKVAHSYISAVIKFPGSRKWTFHFCFFRSFILHETKKKLLFSSVFFFLTSSFSAYCCCHCCFLLLRFVHVNPGGKYIWRKNLKLSNDNFMGKSMIYRRRKVDWYKLFLFFCIFLGRFIFLWEN